MGISKILFTLTLVSIALGQVVKKKVEILEIFPASFAGEQGGLLVKRGLRVTVALGLEYFETTVSMDNEVIYLHLLPSTFLGSVNIFRKKREKSFY